MTLRDSEQYRCAKLNDHMPIEGDVTSAVKAFLRWPRARGPHAGVVERLHNAWLDDRTVDSSTLADELKIAPTSVRKLVERIKSTHIPAFREDHAHAGFQRWSIGNLPTGRQYRLLVENTPHRRIARSVKPLLVDLAVAKMRKDLSLSTCNNIEHLNFHRQASRGLIDAILKSAYSWGRDGKLPIDDRIHVGRVRIPTLHADNCEAALNDRDNDREMWVEPLRRMQDFTVRHKITVRCSANKMGPLAVLKRLQRQGVCMEIRHDLPSGRLDVLSLSEDADVDFAIVPDAAFVLSGSRLAASYRTLFPITREQQAVLYKPDGPSRRQGSRELYVYEDSSADVGLELITRFRDNLSAIDANSNPLVDAQAKLQRKVVWIGILEELVKNAREMRDGDAIIAWEPLASGLQRSDDSLVRGLQHVHYFSFASHDQWRVNGDSLNLFDRQEDLKKVFLYEWKLCCEYPEIAEEIVRQDHDLVNDFAGAAGLRR